MTVAKHAVKMIRETNDLDLDKLAEMIFDMDIYEVVATEPSLHTESSKTDDETGGDNDTKDN